jgi:hypothetical protein
VLKTCKAVREALSEAPYRNESPGLVLASAHIRLLMSISRPQNAVPLPSHSQLPPSTQVLHPQFQFYLWCTVYGRTTALCRRIFANGNWDGVKVFGDGKLMLYSGLQLFLLYTDVLYRVSADAAGDIRVS